MNRIIFFLIATVGLLSCSTYSGPDYYTANPDGKPNGGGYDEATYNEDISRFNMRLDHEFHNGTVSTKAGKAVVNGKTVVNMTYEFKRGERDFIMHITLPDYKGEDIYGGDSTKPASIVFHKRKATPEEIPDSTWTGNEATVIPNVSRGIKVHVTHADAKYIDATFEGNFLITNPANDAIGISNVSVGVIRVQWQR